MRTFCEMFAGIGLVREALEPLGWECVYANDFDKTKREIYAARFPCEDALDPRDVHDIQSEDLPEADLLAASFPCIDLSLAGKREGLAGVHSSTFWEFARLLRGLRERYAAPQAVMIENVTGFLTSHGGEDFRMAVSALNELGYRADAVTVSAEHFTPQSRPRLFVLGIREDLAEELMTTPEKAGGKWGPAVSALPGIRPRRVRDLMLEQPRLTGDSSLSWGLLDLREMPGRDGRLEDIVEWESDEWWSEEKTQRALREMAPLHRERVEEMIGTVGHHVGAAYRRRRKGESVYEVRTDGLAGCLRTAGGGSSKQILVAVEDGRVRMRWMSPREYARLQGSEYTEALDAFSPIALRSAYGDAVCVPAVRWIVERAFGNLPETTPVAARKA